ncbi:MAG TPA: formyltransferase family protein [Gammaproteobacteria bacterium]
MGKDQYSVLFLGKEKDAHVGRAAEFCRLNFASVGVHLGKWGDPLPQDVGAAGWNCIISYLSRWIVPENLLKKAEIAINFHPGSPEYPGYGCNNFAIYEEAKGYGVTCHHMAPVVDTGAIIAVKRFPVLPSDNAATLLARAYDHQLVLFYEIIGRIIRGEALPASEEKWAKKPFTRKQFDALGRITPDMSKEEVTKRVRATTVGVWKPTVEVQGFVFELKTEAGD